MRFRSYLRDHFLAVILWAVASGLGLFFMRGVSVTADAAIYVELLFGLAFWVPFLMDFINRKRWWDRALKMMDGLDKKLRLTASLDDPTFADAEIAAYILECLEQDMNDEVALHERARREYREYLERWIHEVKTPIASAQLTAHNHPSHEMRQVARDLSRIEAHVMQALYYARGEAVEKDYLIEKVTLAELVDAALKRNSRELIAAKFSIEKPDLTEIVYTDPKWIGFVLDQIIQNAVKYRRGEKGLLRFSAYEAESSCDLFIEDSGIGITDTDLPRIFEKGYTGTAGRQYAKSTGMGLYISAQLIGKMGHGIRAGHGTEGGLLLTIRFPKSTMYRITD